MADLNPKQRAVLGLLEAGEEYQNYFFKKATGLVWFLPLKEKGYFAATNNPSPLEAGLYTIPHWSVLDYLEKVSKECAQPENRQYAEELMEIIRDVTRPKSGQKGDNYRTWWYFTKIMSNLPTDAIKLQDVELVGEWLNSRFTTTLVGGEIGKSLLPKLLASPYEVDWEKAAKIVEIVTGIRWVEKKYGEGNVAKEPHAAIETYWLRELFKRNAPLLGEKCGQQVVETLKGRLKEILRPDKDDTYSYIWRPAIEDYAQNYDEDSSRSALVSALRDILSAYSKKREVEAKEILRRLLRENYFILRRTALYVVNEQYQTHRELFWEVLKPELFNSNLRHELFELLRSHFSDFSHEQQNQVVETIASLTDDVEDQSEKALFDTRLRLGWLEAIKGRGNQHADQLYGEYLKLTKYQPEHPEFASYTEAGWVGAKGPCSVDELLSKATPEIINYLREFRETDRWKGPSEEGLREVFKEAVKQKPDKFESQLDCFIEVPVPYLHSIVRAFQEIWSGKKIINWGKVLEFCLSIVESEEFWKENDEPKAPLKATRSWVTSAISDLIKVGVASDEWAFPETDLPVAEKILVKILEREISTAKGEQGDALSEAINTPKGRCLEALFGYSLRQARLCDKRKQRRSQFWHRIQDVFDHELEQCKGGNFEFSALAGQYLPNLFYLSKPWVKKNINKIFSQDYEVNWRCAIEGYAYVNRVYDEIYNLLKKYGHFKKALEAHFKDLRIRKKIIQNIAVGYLRGNEDLIGEDSPFAEILRHWRQDDLSEIISFFWMLRDTGFEEETRKLILDFWKWCYEKIAGRETDNAALLSHLNLLTVFLREVLGEHKRWLLQSAPYVDERHHSSFFLEYLEKLADHSPEGVADVYLQMLTRTTPTYKEQEIRSIVEKLYQKGVRDKANDICNNYARKGYPDLLRNIYERYNM